MRSALIVLAVATGCLRQTQFHCETDGNCGAGGHCQAAGFCSFFDATCGTSQQRFDDSAGALANTCVDGQGGIDAGVDATNDAPPPGNCQGNYLTLSGGNPNHKYQLITVADTWSAESTACIATAPTAYLAIPDDAGELAAIAGLTTATFWVGIDDLAQPGTFVNVKGQPQTFLPWGPGEPHNGKDCVAGVSTTKIASEQCMASFIAVCECED
jgi:hypothetical protein